VVRRLSKKSAAARTKALDLPSIEMTVHLDGRFFWLVKVSSFYLTEMRGLAGDPAYGFPHKTLEEAWKVAREVRAARVWLGRVRVVRRRHLRMPQW
jgi:hypothetical protein